MPDERPGGMTRNIVPVGRDTPVAGAMRLRLDNHISGLPVMDEARQLVGVLTEGDLLRRSETGTEGTARDGSKS